MTKAEAWFNKSLRPRKPEGSLGRAAQDGHLDSHTAPELCSPSLIVHNYGLCGRKATWSRHRAQELCENRGGRPGLPVPNSPYRVSEDVNQN